MKKEMMTTVYFCDCCNAQIGLDSGGSLHKGTLLSGCIYAGGDVAFEPKLFGDYCVDCLEIAQKDYDRNLTNSVASDRYDSYSDKLFEEETIKMKQLREVYLKDLEDYS